MMNTMMAGRLARLTAKSVPASTRDAMVCAPARKDRFSIEVRRPANLRARKRFPYIAMQAMASQPRSTGVPVDSDGVRIERGTRGWRVVGLVAVAAALIMVAALIAIVVIRMAPRERVPPGTNSEPLALEAPAPPARTRSPRRRPSRGRPRRRRRTSLLPPDGRSTPPRHRRSAPMPLCRASCRRSSRSASPAPASRSSRRPGRSR